MTEKNDSTIKFIEETTKQSGLILTYLIKGILRSQSYTKYSIPILCHKSSLLLLK